MQSVSSRIWTRVAVSISYDDNHYTTGTSQAHQLQLVSPSPSCSIVFCSLAKSWYLSLPSLSYDFTLLSVGTAKSTFRQLQTFSFFFFSFFFFLFVVCCWQSQGLIVCLIFWFMKILFSRTDSVLCIYYLFVRSNFNFLHNS